MADDNIINFQYFIKNPNNSDEACAKMLVTIVDHYLGLCQKYSFMQNDYKSQIRKAINSLSNGRNSAYPQAMKTLERDHLGLLREIKIYGYN